MNTFKINTLLIAFSLLSFFVAHSAIAAADIPATVTYSCKWGGTPSGSNCNVAATSYPANYTFSGDAVGGISAANSGVATLTSWPSGVNVVGTSGAGCEAFSKGWSGGYYFHGGVTVAQIKSGRQTYSICGDFSCPILTTLSGQTCTEAAYAYAASPSYSCPIGTTINGTMCTTTTTTYGKCGSANDTPQKIGVTLSEFILQTNLCAPGSQLSGGNPFAISGNSFFWCCSDRVSPTRCLDSGHGVGCATPGICGSANGTVQTTRPKTDSELCAVGGIWSGSIYNTFIMDDKGPWTWQCGTMAQTPLATCSTIAGQTCPATCLPGWVGPNASNQCTKTSTYAATPSCTSVPVSFWGTANFRLTPSPGCYTTKHNTNGVADCPDYLGKMASSCYEFRALPTYSCSSLGDTLSGTTCTKVETVASTVPATCPVTATCTPVCKLPSEVCSGSPIGNDGCGGTCTAPEFGTKTDGVCVPIDNSCADATCIGTQCANNKGTMIDGKLNCSVGTSAWQEVRP